MKIVGGILVCVLFAASVFSCMSSFVAADLGDTPADCFLLSTSLVLGAVAIWLSRTLGRKPPKPDEKNSN